MGFVEEMKWWHWICVSLVVGAALAYVNKNFSLPAEGSIDPNVFAQLVLKPPVKVNGTWPWVKNVWVYPPLTVSPGKTYQLVTFQTLQETKAKQMAYEPCWTVAPLPYLPTGSRNVRATPETNWPGTTIYVGKKGDTLESVVKSQYGTVTAEGRNAIMFANNSLSNGRITSAGLLVINPGQAYFIPWSPASNHTLKDYLDAAKAYQISNKIEDAPVAYHYAFWHAANLVYPVWMGASFVVIGLIWPAVAAILTRGGLGRVREKDEYDLSRFKGGSDARPAVAVANATDEDKRKLEALEAALMASLEASPMPDRIKETKKEEAPVRKLDARPAPAPKEEPKPADGKVKDEDLVYDAFYPVARGGKKK